MRNNGKFNGKFFELKLKNEWQMSDFLICVKKSSMIS